MDTEEKKLTQWQSKDCCIQAAVALHTCPYASEIGGDDETLCDCCKYCEIQCAQEI